MWRTKRECSKWSQW